VRQKSFIVLAVFVFLLIVGAIGVYAYDASRDDLIADGVTVGGVHVGGMRASEARATIEEQLTQPLQKPLVVKYEKQRFRLTAADAHLRVAAERMVQDALEKSREGNVLSRTIRGITGDDPDESELPARVSYSHKAVEDLVKKVEGRVDQPAQNAEVTFSGTRASPSRATSCATGSARSSCCPTRTASSRSRHASPSPKSPVTSSRRNIRSSSRSTGRASSCAYGKTSSS
jgi:hypothetical protein